MNFGGEQTSSVLTDKIEWREKKNVFLAHCVYETIF
jgi:hypothetical protein